MRSLFYTITPILLFAVIGCDNKGQISYDSLDLASVETATAERGNFRVTIDEIGILEASDIIRIFAPFSGKIARIAEDGIDVNEGDFLIELETEEIREDIEDEINSLKEQKADIERTIEDLKVFMRNDTLDTEAAQAKLEYDRTRLLETSRELETLMALAEFEMVAQKDVDSKEMQFGRTRLSVVRSDLDFKKEEISRSVNQDIKIKQLGDLGFKSQSSMNDIARDMKKLDAGTINSPVKGTWIVAKNWTWAARRFEPISVGKEINHAEFLGEVAKESSLVVKSQVSEAMSSFVTLDTPVALTSTALEDREISGEIIKIGNSAIDREQSAAGAESEFDDPSGLKVFELEIMLHNSPPELRPGMSVDISIVREEVEDAVSIPISAIFRKEGLPVVFVKTGSRSVREQPLILGKRSKEMVMVVEGLEGDEELYLEDLNAKLDELKADKGRSDSGNGLSSAN
jgi:multidrug efflux pump subunit AcrA (membrane-fusion protein)